MTDLKRVELTICQPCLDGDGDECHTPGCALWMHRVDIPIDRSTYRVVPDTFLFAGPGTPPRDAPEGLRLLAEWFDMRDDEAGLVAEDREVQRDLSISAATASASGALIPANECESCGRGERNRYEVVTDNQEPTDA